MSTRHPTRQILATDPTTAVGIAEGWIEADNEEQVVNAWQLLIDTGLAWQLQGWFGRRAADLIESGVCTPPGAN